jgi:hypothetical protein
VFDGGVLGLGTDASVVEQRDDLSDVHSKLVKGFVLGLFELLNDVKGQPTHVVHR